MAFVMMAFRTLNCIRPGAQHAIGHPLPRTLRSITCPWNEQIKIWILIQFNLIRTSDQIHGFLGVELIQIPHLQAHGRLLDAPNTASRPDQQQPQRC
jgi:hypothetical protein